MRIISQERGIMVQKPKKLLNTHEDLEVYQIAFNLAMEIFELSRVS
ncbi:MAG: hypothetical protein O9295_04530 [Microcystis sp. LE18-22.4A]|nr:hypothetical protein [Microcystis sp. LE18-22.4A]